MGSDIMDEFGNELKFVSIHAPTWGATATSEFLESMVSFQSTLPHGERLILFLIASTLTLFQSTLPHGERPYTLYKSLLQ